MFLFAPIRWALKLIYFAVLAAVVYVVVSGVQVISASHLPTGTASVTTAEAIVVLPAPAQGSAPGPDLIDRLEQAAALYKANKASTVVVAGAPASPRSAAPTSVELAWLVADSVPASKVVQVTAADSATALTQARSVLGHGASVIVVTDAIDALWTKGAASKAGLAAQISPATGSERSFYQEPAALWRQATGVAVGRIVGYSRATWAAH